MKSLVILPSYNEKLNIASLVAALLKQKDGLEILVVDDNSPDKTFEVIQSYQSTLSPEHRKRVHLIVREKKDGRGGAVRRGLEWGLAEGRFDFYVEMDCDFSHPPEDISKGLELLKSHDVVLGSRYPHGKIVGWPLKRKALSFFANLLARCLISFEISDYTNGFRFYNSKAAKYLCSFTQKHKGYIYLSETLAHLLHGGFIIGTFPIIFVNRVRGEGNTNFAEVLSAFKGIFSIGRDFRLGTRKNSDRR